MRIVNFKSGLGNQIFYYLFCLYLQERHPQEKIYGFYNPQWLKKHSGLELDYAFDVEFPPQTIWSKFVTNIVRAGNKWFKNLCVTDRTFYENAIYYDGWWQNKRFFFDNIKKIKFRERDVSEKNKEILNQIFRTQSVAIHIRRGDYLEPKHIKEYGGICTLDYYNNAIDIVSKLFDTPRYFVFSNDIEWVKENMEIPNPVYVNNNKGIDSYMDMYLMSKCKANIIANSSFSYWGAMLNVNSNVPVVYPKKWFNTHTPDIFPTDWIGI